MEVEDEIAGMFTLYKDGSVLRPAHPTTPASSHFTDGVASKDVVINPETGVWARIFKPETASEKSPLLIYFHGGGFADFSTAWVEYHNFFHNLCKTAGIMILSADYRLAPEHRLPTAYDDCTETVEWVAKHAAGRAEMPEEWLSPSVVDFSRCVLAGESAGGNIAYHVGLRIGDLDLRPLMVKGVVAIHPFFGGEELVESEKGEEMMRFVEICKFTWRVALPVGSSRDHRFSNPAVLPLEPGLKLPPVLVAVGGKDELKERGVMFYEYLRSCGKEAELMVEEGGVHAFHIFIPEFEGTLRLIQRISDFVNMC
ncbi:hypothetical protein SUGI_0999130 [Cryptomeria japonica]|uniref:probable carboxylesterase 17 n=1 Tax=Cryptomeria japonica TaxID=3369 RepID=UPI002414A138|nr:probable carboxylesterase 17 [Cryptomeria japonica]GLJ47319.1 hypothetical protein SUGI_0999130 [Cryptomeria japonica]